jgi:hypothetical protein
MLHRPGSHVRRARQVAASAALLAGKRGMRPGHPGCVVLPAPVPGRGRQTGEDLEELWTTVTT